MISFAKLAEQAHQKHTKNLRDLIRILTRFKCINYEAFVIYMVLVYSPSFLPTFGGNDHHMLAAEY